MQNKPFQPGNLIEITRASIGIPLGSIALVIEEHDLHQTYTLYTVRLVGNNKGISIRRYLKRDMKVVS